MVLPGSAWGWSGCMCGGIAGVCAGAEVLVLAVGDTSRLSFHLFLSSLYFVLARGQRDASEPRRTLRLLLALVATGHSGEQVLGLLSR